MKNKITLLVLSLALAFSMLAFSVGCPSTTPTPVCYCAIDDLFLFNPYRNVDFSSFGRYRADFHTHTSNSDGTASPNEQARRFASVGFDFLAIAEHDSWTYGRHPNRPGVIVTGDVTSADSIATAGNPVITNFNLNSPNRANWVQTWPWSRFGVQEGYHGLIPIQANEVTRTQHFGNFYTSFTDQTVFGSSVALSGTGKADVMNRAIAHSMHYYPCDRYRTNEPTIQEGQIRFELFHPERYLARYSAVNTFEGHIVHLDRPAVNGVYPRTSAGYYQQLINDFPTILSIEVFNQADRHPSIHIYDRIMRDMFPARPVWLSANSDEHGIHFGYSANVMLLEERTEGNFRRAREQGAYFAVSFGAFNPNYLELDYNRRYLAATTLNANGHHWTHNPHEYPRLTVQRWGDRWYYVPNILDIQIDCCSGYITVIAETEASNVYTEFLWFTEDGELVQEGNIINFRTNEYISNYVRGELRNYMYIDGERTHISTKLMQPFGVGLFDAESWFFHFTGVDLQWPKN